ncbi:MAG: prepilin peptidase [Acidobacteria bacterium]|nr:prepilin peptidase [Acidobacteriota bacterium]
MLLWLLTLAGVLGLCIGSFLNVCIYRLPLEKSLAWPASHCPTCSQPLKWYDNVPIVAWLALGGKCRSCGTRISVVYPFVEAFTGVMFVWATWQYGIDWLLASRLVFGCALIVLFFIDLEHRILPNGITIPGTVIGFLFSFVAPPGWVSSLIGLVVGGLIPLVVAEIYYRVRRIEGLGMGDVKMLALVGAFLGWPQVLLTLVVASLLGSIVGLPLAIRQRDMKASMPFGTFLAIAAMFAATAGDSVIAWYLGFYR